MTEPVYEVGIEFAAGSFTNITADVKRVTVNRGISSPLDPIQPAAANVVLDNSTGDYSPDYAGSVYAGLMRPNLGLRVRVDRQDCAFFQNSGGTNGNAILFREAPYAVAPPDSPKFTLACSFLLRDASHSQQVIFDTGRGFGDSRVLLQRVNPSSGHYFAVNIGNTVNSTYSIAIATGTQVNSGDRATLLLAADVSSGTYELWVNDVEDTPTSLQVLSSANLNFANSHYVIGGHMPVSGRGSYTGVIDWFYFAPGVYIDFSAASNRRLFHKADLTQIDLGSAGHYPTGSNVAICLSGTFSEWITNRGYIGSLFTYNSLSGVGSGSIVVGSGSSTVTMFQGVIDEWMIDPSLEAGRQTILSCRDTVRDLNDRTISTSLFINYNIGSIFTVVLSLANVRSFAIETITDEQPYIWFRDRQATGVIEELLNEGFFFGFVDGAGTMQIKDRFYDIKNSIVTRIDEFRTLQSRLNDDLVFNKVRIEGIPRELDPDVRTVAYTGFPLLVPASATNTFFLEYLDPDNLEPAPATQLVTPVNSTDYVMFVNSDGTGTELTATASASVTFFGQAAKTIIFNGTGTDGWLTRYGIRGKPIHRRARISSVSEDSSSQAVYGEKEFTLESPLFASQLYNSDYSDYIRDKYKDPKSEISFTLANEFPRLFYMEIADKLILTNSISGISSVYVIESVNHSINLETGLIHEVSIKCSTLRDLQSLILDDAARGILDTNRLGF